MSNDVPIKKTNVAESIGAQDVNLHQAHSRAKHKQDTGGHDRTKHALPVIGAEVDELAHRVTAQITELDSLVVDHTYWGGKSSQHDMESAQYDTGSNGWYKQLS